MHSCDFGDCAAVKGPSCIDHQMVMEPVPCIMA